jgi:hypothetical protein
MIDFNQSVDVEDKAILNVLFGEQKEISVFKSKKDSSRRSHFSISEN